MKEYIEREAVCNDCNNRDICVDKRNCAAGRAIDKVGQALNVAGAFYAQGYHDAMTDHNLVERKRGEWVPCENGGYYCSNCDRRVAFLVHNNFCPNCGADMIGEKNG